jgi:hypothetical protein
MTKQLATSLALAAASLFVSGCNKGESATAAPEPAADPTAKVKCMGVNECRGQGACNTATHDCAGQNECAGKGWIQITRAECTEKGGTEV